MIEAIMSELSMSFLRLSALYSELSSRMLKVVVNDRNKFKTIFDESKLTEPKELQDDIEKIASNYENGRSFVRPSGTEDCLRIYAEANTQEEADELGNKVLKVIEEKYSQL
jgi:phosphoacetylglucosamine mutase